MFTNPIFMFCMLLFPIMSAVFFTTMMGNGAPTDLPVGVVDQDNTSTSRKLIRTLDSFQSSRVVAHYADVNDAREAIQRGEIYAFLLIPSGTSDALVAQRQPKISFYYSSVVLLAGGNTFKDLKTVSTLGSASVGMAKLSALGKTGGEIKTFLQPIVVDLHQIGNPWSNYNVYLSTTFVPGLIMLFVFLITPYSIGTELKFGRAREWMSLAGGNPVIAIAGKMFPQTLIFLTVFLGFEFYIYHILGFPHPGGYFPVIMLGLLSVLAGQGFGIFAFGIMPSLRMSMSICSLWAMLSFSMSGATFPVSAMDTPLQALSWLFPLRHYYMIYQMTIFNGYPVLWAWQYWLSLSVFIILPAFVMGRIRKAMMEYKYIA